MSSKLITQIPEYFNYFKFIVNKKQFTSNEFVKEFISIKSNFSKFKKTEYAKAVQNLSKKLQKFTKIGFISKSPTPIKQGKETSRDNYYQYTLIKNSIFNYFLNDYFFNSNFNLNKTKSENLIINYKSIFNDIFSNLLLENLQNNSIKTIDQLLKTILPKISLIGLNFSLKNYQQHNVNDLLKDLLKD